MAESQEEFEARMNALLSDIIPEEGTPAALAKAQNEMVAVWENEGFKRDEALYMVAVLFCGNPGFPP